MKNKKYLIVGVDPGITTGLCAIDLNGKLVKTYSSKKMGIEKIISWMESVGIPIVIACDVKVPPFIVKKLSMLLKAKLVHPPYDLKVGEKQKMTSGLPTKDDHQRDSCAAALFAFKKYNSLFRRVDVYIDEIGKPEKGDEIKKKLILGGAKSIKDAAKEKVEKINLQRKKRSRYIEKESLTTSMKKEIDSLKKLLEKSKERIVFLENENKKLKKKLSLKKSNSEMKSLAEKRKSVIKTLEEKILLLKVEISKLKKINSFVENECRVIKARDCYIVRKVKNLSDDEISKIENAFGDALLVEELTLPSKRTLGFLKRNRISVILFRRGKKLKDILLSKGFTIVDEKDVNIKSKEGVHFVDKEDIDSAIKKGVLIERVIKEYKSKRH